MLQISIISEVLYFEFLCKNEKYVIFILTEEILQNIRVFFRHSLLNLTDIRTNTMYCEVCMCFIH